jgi:hypothetical protein
MLGPDYHVGYEIPVPDLYEATASVKVVSVQVYFSYFLYERVHVS